MSVAPIRSRTSYFSAGTSKSLSYTEGTALDNTHLLVAVVQVAHATAISSVTPSGWTELSGGGANSTNQVRIYARQGDGTTNSISITSSSAVGAITLLAFEGYTSLTPLYAAGAAGTASTSRTVSTGTVSGYGVAIAAIGVVGTVTWGSWTGATRAGSIANASQRLDVGWSLYDDEGNAKVTHTLTWGTSRTQYIVGVVLPIATPASPQPLMAFSFDENSGGFARDSVSGTLTTDIGLWATGHTNSGIMNPNGDAGAYPDGPDSTTTEWTFMAWGKVQSASASGTRQIMLAHDPDQVADNIIHVEVATNGMLKLLVMQDTTWSMLTTTDLGTIDTAWHHFALVRHGQAVQLYIDGWPVSYLPTAYTTAAQNMALMGFGLAANWNNADAVYADDLRIFDKALSRAQIQTFQATPVPAAIVPVTPDLPTPVAHTSVSALGVDTSLSPALPANSLSYIALVNRHEGTNAPDGWTLIHNEQTTDTDGTHYSIWHANAPVTAPSWVIGTNGANDEPYSALVMGYDRATMVSNFTFNSDNVVSPSVTTTEPGTLVRTSIDGNDSSSAPGFPVNATLGRAENSPYSATWSATVAIAHEYRETPGATGTATWSIPVEWKAFSSTFLLTEVAAPTNLPMAAYNFNEGTGNSAEDASGNGRTASVSAWTTGRTSTGAIGNATESAMRFSGSLIPAASAVTMMFWAYPTSAPQDQSLGSIGSGPGGDDLWMQPYWGDATHLHLGVRTSAGWYGVQSSVTTPLNAWVHVAVSWNHATNSASIFINGIETGTVTTEGILSDIDWLEAGGWAAASNFNVGTVDDLRVFDAALSSAEVTEWMNTPISGAPTPLPISQYGFNEGSGGYARDSSGNNRTIAVDSTKWTATSKNGPGIVGNAFAHAVLGPSILTARTIMFWLTIDASPPSGSYDNIITSGVMEETGRFEALYLNQDSVDGPQIGYYWQNGSGQTFNVEYNTPAGYSSSSAHIAITTGPAGLAVYFNGQQIGAASGFTTVMGLSDVHMSESGTHLLQGTIDELRTFDAALDSTKITYWMNTPVAGIAPARTTPQPIAAYGFNEGTGTTAVDSSGGSHTLPVVSSAWSSNGKTGNAVTGQAFSNANIGPNSLTARTTMFWIRMSALPAFEGIVDLIGSGNVNSAEAADVIYLYKSTSGGSTIALGHYFKAPSGGTSLDDSYTVTIPLNTYVHIACVNGPGGAQLYFNGVIQGIVSSSVAAVGMNEISMGSSTYPANNVILDELRFFNSELTGDEITYWMNTSILSSAQPIAAYGFHETSGTSIADSSPNNNTLTIGSGYLGGGEYTSEGENSPGAYRLTFNNPTTEGTIMGHIIPGTDQFLNAEESLFGFWSNDGDPGGSTYFALWRNRTSFGGSSGLQGNVRIAGTLHEIASNEVLLPGGHYHVALSFGPTGTRIYLDGVEVGAYPGLTGPLSSGGQFSLGADNDNTVFDDVRVFDKQLSLAEINSWRSTPVAAPGSGEPSTQTVVWRGRAGGATVTFVRAAVRIGGQTVPIINGAMRVSGSTVPLRLGSTSQSPFDVLGSSSVGRVGSGAITVPLPAGSGGSVIIFLSGNQLSEPSIPAGWTKINWSTANPAVATGIYQRTSPSANPTFNVTQPVDGGIAAVAFRVRGQINAVSAVGSTDVVTSPSATSSAQSLVVRTIVSSLDEPVETTLSFPVGTHNQQSVLTGGNDAGTMVAGAISKVVNASTASGTAVWSLNNIGTSRAATWLLEIT